MFFSLQFGFKSRADYLAHNPEKASFLLENDDFPPNIDTFSIMNHFHLHKGFALTQSNFEKYTSSPPPPPSFSKFSIDPFIPTYKSCLFPPSLSTKNVTIRFFSKLHRDPDFLGQNISYYQWSFIFSNRFTEMNFGFALFCKTQLSLIRFLLLSFLNLDSALYLFKIFLTI